MRQFLRAVSAVVVVLATLVAGEAIIRARPSLGDISAPFPIEAEPSQPVTVDGVTVTVLGVRGAATLRRTTDQKVIDTSGVWVIVRLRLEAITETTDIGYLALTDARDRSFRVSDRFRQLLGEGIRSLQPGLPVEGEAAFEVPRDAVGLRLRATETFTEVFELTLKSVADIDLRIPAGSVERWAADSTPAELADVRFVS
jgi:hypothetical protein